MHKAVPASNHNISALHFAYIANKFQLLVGLENSRDQCFNTKTNKTKTAEFRSRDQDRGLEDYKTKYLTLPSAVKNLLAQYQYPAAIDKLLIYYS